MRTRRLLLAAACAAAGAATAAPAVQAAVTPSSLTTSASNTGAATRPNFTVSFNLTSAPSGDDARRIIIDLPPGLLGDVHAIAKCSTSQFNGDNCAGSTDIGDVSANVTATILGIPTPISAPGDIYLLPAQGTEAARMGVVLRPIGGLLGKIHLLAPVRVRSGADYGLRATIDSLPRSHSGLPIRMTQMSMTLSGTVGSTPFISAPTTCAAATTRVDVLAYDDGQTRSASGAYTPTNCAAVPFTPSASIAVSPAVPDAPAQTSITLAVPATASPRIQSHLRSATIALPEGMEVNPAAATSGLEACADAAFGAGSAAPAACPAASAVGDITIDNAQLGTLSGGVHLGAPGPGQLLRLLIVAERSGAADDVRVKLTGAVTADAATGRVTAQLDGIPQVPFRSMTMRLRGGDNAILRTPRTCGDTTLGTSLTPWSGAAAAAPGATLAIAGCGDAARFTPSVGIAATPAQAGASGAVDVSISRPDGDARLAGARISLPAGLMGKLTGVPQCPLDAARAGVCAADTKVGSATAAVGAGAAPLSLPGDLHLTPPAAGGLAGLVLLLDARVGPLDLGRVSVPMELRLREGGAGIDVVVADIPRRLSGIPLDLRSIALRIDRPGFMVNPTSCATRALDATLTSDLGGTATASAPFQATGCEALGYAPRLRMAFTGQVGKNGYPGVDATLTLPEGQANTEQVGLLLPAGVAPDSDRLRNACPLAKAQEGACPASARIGEAVASTPALPTDLRGPIWFVTAPGSVLPELFVRLDGAARIDLRGAVTFSQGRSLVTFAGIPDVALDSFALKLEGGRRGVLTTSRDLCSGASPAITTDLRAHSGVRRPGRLDPAVDGCRAGTGGAKVSARLTHLRTGEPRLRIVATAGDAPLKTVRLTLPKGYTVSTKRVRKLSRITGLKRTGKTLRTGRRTITLNLGAKGVRRVRVDLRRGALRVSRPGLRRAKRVTLGVRATPTKGRATTVKLRVAPARR